MTNNWRALARMARDRLVATTGGDAAILLDVGVLPYYPRHYTDTNSA